MSQEKTLARLQKILAAAGIGSRRECETVITEGRVEVDRVVVTTLGTKVSDDQEIRVDGSILPRQKFVYVAVNKPVGVVSTASDPAGRKRVIDLVSTRERLFPVGRLDKDSEGLILLTNDGDLANRVTHPRYGLEKTYHVQVAGLITEDTLKQLREGIYLAEAFVKVQRIKIKSRHKKSTLLEMVLDEGRNREIRRMLARLKHKVQWLRRVAIGPLRLGTLAAGQSRFLITREIQALRKATTVTVNEDAEEPKQKRVAQSKKRKHSTRKTPIADFARQRKYKKPKKRKTREELADEKPASKSHHKKKKKKTRKQIADSESDAPSTPRTKTTKKKRVVTKGRRTRGIEKTIESKLKPRTKGTGKKKFVKKKKVGRNVNKKVGSKKRGQKNTKKGR